MRPLTALFLLASASLGADLCPSGISLGEFQLVAAPPKGGMGLPVHTLNRLVAGSRVFYSPLKQDAATKAEVALLVATADQSRLVLLEPKRLNTGIEWRVPTDVSLAAVIWGPEGLDESRIRKFGERERPVILQLARYAEQTAMTETLLKALSGNPGTQGVDSAISSFATQYGAGGKLDRTAPPDQQMLTMLRSINPALASYDPLTPEHNVRLQQSAMLAASVAGMFFGSTVGLGAGSAALLANMRTLMFPKLSFRSSFVQPSSGDYFALCGRLTAREPRSRPAYVWAFQIANAETPGIAFEPAPAVLPVGIKTTAAVQLTQGAWTTVRNIRDWALVDTSGTSKPVSVRLAEDYRLEIDLSTDDWPAGEYRLTGLLDWGKVDVKGAAELVPFPDLRNVRPDSASHDRLQTGLSNVSIRLTGSDFRFVEQLSWRGLKQTWPEPKSLHFRRESDRLATELNLSGTSPGDYVFLLKQRNGRVDEAPFRVLPRPPAIEGLPLRINRGESSQRLPLSGSGIDQIVGAEADDLNVKVDKSALIISSSKDLAVGKMLSLRVYLRDYQDPIILGDAIRVAGPLPRVTSIRVAAQQAEGLELRPGEIAAGGPVTIEARLANPGSAPTVRVGCRQGGVRQVELRSGETSADGRVQDLRGALLVSLDPGKVGGTGCELLLQVESEHGESERLSVGRVVRVPRLSKLILTDEPAGEGHYFADVEGEELELVGSVGWSSEQAVAVTELPVAAEAGQRLRIRVPWPSPSPRAVLYVRLHGDTQGRRSSVRF